MMPKGVRIVELELRRPGHGTEIVQVPYYRASTIQEHSSVSNRAAGIDQI